jgi:hypothetical protein
MDRVIFYHCHQNDTSGRSAENSALPHRGSVKRCTEQEARGWAGPGIRKRITTRVEPVRDTVTRGLLVYSSPELKGC